MLRLALGCLPHWRRGLTPCLMLSLAFSLAPRSFAQRTDFHIRTRQTAASSLTLIKPTDTAFDSALESYFPGLSEEDNYQQAIRPFLAIVRNDNGLPAVAYAITWTAHYADGSVRPLRAVFVNRPLMGRGAMTYLRPGGICLIAPMFNVTPTHYSWFKSFYPASSFPPSQGLVAVDENVDGVVYSDGSFIGADKTRVLQRYVMSQFAARDEVLAVANLINSSTAPQFMMVEQLENMFKGQDQQGERAYQHTLLALYVRGRGRTAMDLRRILQTRGIAGLQKLLQNFVNRSGGNTNFSAFGRMYEKLSDSDPRVFGTIPWRPKGPEPRGEEPGLAQKSEGR